MIRIFLPFFIFTLFISAAVSKPVSAKEFISLKIPEKVIADATAAILPVRLDASSKSVEGNIDIINISELALTEDHLICRLHVVGTNLAIVTEIAGHEIRLKVGTLEIDFKTESAIRFDTKTQTLFIKPKVKDISSGGKGSGADIGQVLVAVLNDREFPVTVQDLDPLIARAGAKTIIIDNTIFNIEAKPQAILLSLLPAVTTKQ